MWGTLSDERAQSFLGPSPILLSQIRDSTNLEGQVPVFISPRNRAAQLYPQALRSFFVASYDSQGTAEIFEPASTRGTFLTKF
jgi:hypothetical protein